MTDEFVLISAAIIAVVCSAFLVLSGLMVRRAEQREEKAARHALLASRVVIQLRDGAAVAGLLTRRPPGFFVIENGRLLEGNGEVPVDGEAWLPVERVSWIQVEGNTPWQ